LGRNSAIKIDGVKQYPSFYINCLAKLKPAVQGIGKEHATS